MSDKKKLPVNEGNLPWEYDEHGNIVGIAWRGYTIREQFPWTRSIGEQQ